MLKTGTPIRWEHLTPKYRNTQISTMHAVGKKSLCLKSKTTALAVVYLLFIAAAIINNDAQHLVLDGNATSGARNGDDNFAVAARVVTDNPPIDGSFPISNTAASI